MKTLRQKINDEGLAGVYYPIAAINQIVFIIASVFFLQHILGSFGIEWEFWKCFWAAIVCKVALRAYNDNGEKIIDDSPMGYLVCSIIVYWCCLGILFLI